MTHHEMTNLKKVAHMRAVKVPQKLCPGCVRKGVGALAFLSAVLYI